MAFADFPRLTAPEIARRRGVVRAELLARSKHVKTPDFAAITAADLRLLFDAIDRVFFEDRLARLTARRGGTRCAVKFSKRLTAAGGRTTRRSAASIIPGMKARTHTHEITISSRLLFDNFQPGQRPVESCGVACASRLDALERVMEHEMLHLYEFLAFGNSHCTRPRFQTIARDLFGHASHKHTLVTPRETRTLAARPTREPSAVTVGMRVRFLHAGRAQVGEVTRVGKRATVLVAMAAGRFLLRGKRCAKYYVPLMLLAPVDGE